jgi:hypothetical protein
MLKNYSFLTNISLFIIKIPIFVGLIHFLIYKKYYKMKTKLLFLTLLACFGIANAQYTVSDRSGNVLNNGDVIEYGVLTYPEASYDFTVTNDNTTDEIYTRIEYIGETNTTNGKFEQLCYGLCYNALSIGETVPPSNEPALAIGVGITTGLGNHFWNNDPGNGTDNVDSQFAFRQYSDAAGTMEIGTPLVFTYRYNPTLGVNSNSVVKLTVQSTVVSNEIVLDIAEPVQMKMYSIQGKVVKQASFETGRQIINVSDLSAQAYILQFQNQTGGVQTTKILVQ